MESVAKKIYKRITAKKPGWVFVPADFFDISTSRDVLDQTLSRMNKDGKIRRLARGLYYFPKYNARFGEIAPSINNVVKAMERATGSKLQVSGAMAANVLGLSTQVPGKIIYLTDANISNKKIGNQTIIFKRTVPKKLVGAGKISGAVFQALRYLGKDGIDEKVIERLSNMLNNEDKKVISKDAWSVPGWMVNTINRIIQLA